MRKKKEVKFKLEQDMDLLSLCLVFLLGFFTCLLVQEVIGIIISQQTSPAPPTPLTSPQMVDMRNVVGVVFCEQGNCSDVNKFNLTFCLKLGSGIKKCEKMKFYCFDEYKLCLMVREVVE